MDFGEVEQIESDLVLQDSEIGAVFRGEVGRLEVGQAVLGLFVERALGGEAFRAEIVQHFVQILFLVLV